MLQGKLNKTVMNSDCVTFKKNFYFRGHVWHNTLINNNKLELKLEFERCTFSLMSLYHNRKRISLNGFS